MNALISNYVAYLQYENHVEKIILWAVCVLFRRCRATMCLYRPEQLTDVESEWQINFLVGRNKATPVTQLESMWTRDIPSWRNETRRWLLRQQLAMSRTRTRTQLPRLMAPFPTDNDGDPMPGCERWGATENVGSVTRRDQKCKGGK